MGQKLYRVGLLAALLVVSITGCGVAYAAVVEEAVVAGDVEAAPAVIELLDEVKPETVAELNAQGKITVIDVMRFPPTSRWFLCVAAGTAAVRPSGSCRARGSRTSTT